MESVIGKYSKYVKDNYDLDNPLIKLKYDHSIRVASLMIYLANRLKLNSDDIILAFYIGLFHDLGRYREVVRSNTFNNLTFDHGAYSNKILFNDGIIKNFDIKEEDYLVIRKALYYHNKKDIGKDLNERELLFTNMIRDVDKLDILDIRSKGKKLYFNDYPNTKILDSFFNNETIDIRDIHTSNDSCVFYLSFLKDLNFEESKDFAERFHYLDKLLSIIIVDDNFEDLLNYLVEKSMERGKVYVR